MNPLPLALSEEEAIGEDALSEKVIGEKVMHIRAFMEKEQADALFAHLKTTVPWQKVPYFKRNICHYDGMDEVVNRLVAEVQVQLQRFVKGAFLNYYEDGLDYAPYHADKYGCDVVLVSLGTTRVLRYMHNTTKEKTDFEMRNGDMLFIQEKVNDVYKHSLLKRTRVTLPRISILMFLV
jgi:hypothetical protein